MKLKQLRESLNITQKDLSKKLNMSPARYNNYETSKTQPDIATLCKIADFYGVSLDYICDHKTNDLADFGALTKEQTIAIKILLSLPQSNFFEYLGRLKATADLYKLSY